MSSNRLIDPDKTKQIFEEKAHVLNLKETKPDFDVDAKEDGFTALHLAVKGNQVDVVASLLKLGANPGGLIVDWVFSKDGVPKAQSMNLLCLAANASNFEMIHFLLVAIPMQCEENFQQLDTLLRGNVHLKPEEIIGLCTKAKIIYDTLQKKIENKSHWYEFVSMIQKSFDASGSLFHSEVYKSLKKAILKTTHASLKDQLRAFCGNLFYQKYQLHQGAKSLAIACMEWADVSDPYHLTSADNFAIGSALYLSVIKEPLHLLAFSHMDFSRRENKMVSHLKHAEMIVPDDAKEGVNATIAVLLSHFRDDLSEVDLSGFNAKRIENTPGWRSFDAAVKKALIFLVNYNLFGNEESKEFGFFTQLANLKCEIEKNSKESLTRVTAMLKLSEFGNMSLMTSFFGTARSREFQSVLVDLKNALTGVEKQLVAEREKGMFVEMIRL